MKHICRVSQGRWRGAGLIQLFRTKLGHQRMCCLGVLLQATSAGSDEQKHIQLLSQQPVINKKKGGKRPLYEFGLSRLLQINMELTTWRSH